MAKIKKDPLRELQFKLWFRYLRKVLELSTSVQFADWLDDHHFSKTTVTWADMSNQIWVPYENLVVMCNRYFSGEVALGDNQIKQIHHFLLREFSEQPEIVYVAANLISSGPNRIWEVFNMPVNQLNRLGSIEDHAYSYMREPAPQKKCYKYFFGEDHRCLSEVNIYDIQLDDCLVPYWHVSRALSNSIVSFMCSLQSLLKSIDSSEWRRAGNSVSQLYSRYDIENHPIATGFDEKNAALMTVECSLINMVESIIEHEQTLKPWDIKGVEFVRKIWEHCKWVLEIKKYSRDASEICLHALAQYFIDALMCKYDFVLDEKTYGRDAQDRKLEMILQCISNQTEA